MRRCIGCRQSRPQEELMRFTAEGSTIIADIDLKRDGRGIYLCRNNECAEKALKSKAFNRILRSAVKADEIREVIGTALKPAKEGMNV